MTEPAHTQEEHIQTMNEEKQQPGHATVTVRVPYSVKVDLQDMAEDAKMTLSSFVATRLYKVSQGQLVRPNQVAPAEPAEEGMTDQERKEYDREISELRNTISSLQEDQKAPPVAKTHHTNEHGETLSELTDQRDALQEKVDGLKRKMQHVGLDPEVY